MIGDKLASGAPSATFTGPRIKFEEAEVQFDLRRLPAQAFKEKYMITEREYQLMISSDGEATNALAREIETRIEAIKRLTEQDQQQDESLKRDCPFAPFCEPGWTGKVVVTRDQPALRQMQSRLALPRHMRQQREKLPTTGKVIESNVYDGNGVPRTDLMGLRVIFGPMSGTAICFSGYPTFITLDIAEIIATVRNADAEIVEQEIEPMV